MVIVASIPHSLPFEDPVLIFGLAMLLVLLAPLLIRLLRLPSIVGLIAAGIVVGPNALGLLERDATIVLLGTVGLLYLMFMAGLEIDLNEFARSRKKSVLFGLSSFAIPQGLGVLVGLQLGLEMGPAVLLGSLFASHTLLAYPIASRLRIGKLESSTMAVGGTIITDVLALFVLAVVVGSQEGDLNREFWVRLIGSMVLYTAGVFLIVPRLGRWFFRRVENDAGSDYIFALAVLFVCSFLAEVAGIEAIVGAFFAGLALNRLIPESSTLMNRINFVGNTLFVPFFLLSVGMLVDVRVFFDGGAAILVAAVMSVTVVFAKFAAARISQMLFGFSADEGWVIFGLSIPQAAATLAATLIGYDIGLFDQAIVNGVIVMILVTCVIGPAVVERYGARVADAEAARPAGADASTPHRILVPVVRAADLEATLDFAMALRDHHSEEALYPIRVVQESGGPAEVASAERLLHDAEHFTAGASVPVVPLTRLAADAPSGIARAIVEQRISSVVLAWPGVPVEGGIFGRTIDGVIASSGSELFAVHLAHPINATRRLVVAVMPGTPESDGFQSSVLTLKKLAQQLGALLTVLCLEAEKSIVETTSAAGPAVAISLVTLDTLERMLGALGENLETADIAVVLTSREVLARDAAVREIPRRLSSLVPGTFVVQLTPEAVAAEPGLDAEVLEELLRRALLEVQPGGRVQDLLVALLEMEFHLDETLPESLALELRTHGQHTDVAGARVYHLQSAMVPYPVDVVAFGHGRFDDEGTPLRAVGLVLTPADESQRRAERRAQEMAAFIDAAMPHLAPEGPPDLDRLEAEVRKAVAGRG